MTAQGTAERLGRTDESGEMLVDEKELAQLLGLWLPYFIGGAHLTEAEMAEQLGLSTRQVRSLKGRGMPNRVDNGVRTYPQLDAQHWYLAFKVLSPRSHFSIWEARQYIMSSNLECDPVGYAQVPRKLANRLRPAGCDVLDQRWGDAVVIPVQVVEIALERLEGQHVKEAPARARRKPVRKNAKRSRTTRSD